MQFKSFPVAFITKPLSAAMVDKIPISEFSGKLFDIQTLKQLAHPSRSGALMQLLTVTTLLGGMSIWSKRICSKGLQGLKELANAKDFADVLHAADIKLNTKFFESALLQGGGLRLIGDFLLG